MTQFLPPNLLALFKPRDPIPYLPPVDKLPYEKRTSGYTGLADFVQHFEDPATTPAPVKIKTREERRAEKRQQKAEATAYKLEQDIALWNPQRNPNSTTDPYKTLFVARINYDTSEAKLRREFEIYGPIKKIVMVHDLSRKPRGYAFIEYERERDMHSAYKHADGKKIEGKRVLVDVEKGRTVKGWLPRRLGGGLGGTRRGGPDVNLKHSGREENRSDDRYIDRDRDRLERPERRRTRSRSRERRRKSRSRSRDRHRSDRHKRERSRDRDRGRDLALGAGPGDVNMDGPGDVIPDGEPPRKERRRSRSRDRDRKRRRSRSRDRKRHDRDRDRDRDRRDRESRRERGVVEQHEERIKEEPVEPPEPVQDNFNSTGYEGEYNYNNGEPNAYEGY
ncbi:U1 small nuclear ribonucleoprotein 70 kDa-like [Argiope bruennichi]|uniref:U1 small nuclear ribonucleoprotein 70 kDa-like n=1 Tax=Argiope bruennichi TaxID=94029 RepID=UPI0024954914|nr:U1 small nuclear ribonucleoprotein 70 kDa-like [Argiope bruennichi]